MPTLPAGVCSGHVENLSLPAGYSARQLIGQLVDVQDAAGNHYLLGGTSGCWVLHLRPTPAAAGHARNATEYGPPLAFPKDTADA